MIKINVEIVTGFIGSGKTKFINSLIENSFVQGERVVIVQYEYGESELSEEIIKNTSIKVIKLQPSEFLNVKKLNYIIGIYSPHRVIIEFNSTRRLEDFIVLFQNSKYNKRLKISTIYHLSDAITFQSYIENMEAFIVGSISNSDLIIINNFYSVAEESKQWINNKIEELNQEAYILRLPDFTQLNKALKKEDIVSGGLMKKCSIFIKNLYIRVLSCSLHIY
jgi:G3E family GTPase